MYQTTPSTQVFQHDTACLTVTMELGKDHSVPVASRTFCGRHGSHAIEIVCSTNGLLLGGLPPFEDSRKSSFIGSQIEDDLDCSLFGIRLFYAKSALFRFVGHQVLHTSRAPSHARNRIKKLEPTVPSIKQSKQQGGSLAAWLYHIIVQRITTATFNSSRHAQNHLPCSSFGSQGCKCHITR